jgi:hypothetical protein
MLQLVPGQPVDDGVFYRQPPGTDTGKSRASHTIDADHQRMNWAM